MAKKYHPDKCSLREAVHEAEGMSLRGGTTKQSEERSNLARSPTTSSYGRENKKDCEEMMRKLNEAHETILAFLSSYRYCFNQKPTEEEEWEEFKERFYKDFII